MARHCIVGQDYNDNCDNKDCSMKELCKKMYNEREMGYSD